MTVFLIGAGPGKPDLLTMRGGGLLASADVVIHDRLVGEELFTLVKPDAELIDVGKRPGAPYPQEEINELLIANGRIHETVVRLKGGDPFVFGRGGEELAALHAAGVAAEVVPGITSAIAAPAYAGIPVTHRPIATSFTVVTGHRMKGEDEVNWEALAQVGGTIVVLMGVTERARIASRLIAGGLAESTPVAAITWATYKHQSVDRTTLANLGALELSPPATIVIGEVAALELDWFT